MHIGQFILLAVFNVFLLSGCAATHSTIDVSIPQPQQVSGKVLAKILDVKDMRRFASAPSDPSVPSLGDTSNLNNPAITTRAVARKRGGFGMALANIFLPEGRTVEQVVRESATKALAEKGYTVVREGSPDFSVASPVNIEIQQFWSWLTPGAFQVSLEFVGVVLLKGDVFVEGNEQSVRGYSIVNTMAATDSQWQEVMQNGVQDLIEKMKAKIKSPS